MFVLAAIATFFVNVYAMFYIGLEGLEPLPPIFLPLVYFGGVFFWAFILCAKADPAIRKLMLLLVISAWLPIVFIAIPQFPEEPGEILLLIMCPVSIWFMQVPGEYIAGRITRGEHT